MASILEQLGQAFYQEIGGRSETYMQEFTLLDAWRFFIEMSMETPKIKVCALGIERKGNYYEIMQVMMTESGRPVKSGGDYVKGRTVKAYELGDDLIEFLDGSTQKNLYISTLSKSI